MTAQLEAGRGATRAGADGSWTVLRLILWSADFLAEKGVETARLDAEHLLAHVVGVTRLQLYLEYDRPLHPSELDGFRPLLRRRAKREPLQYIIGRQPFRELDLEVGPAVLIPRPETEVLVGEVLAWAAQRGTVDATALDVGTGSGAIALSLALEGTFASVLAIDVDEEALAVARRNRESSNLDDRVELRRGDLFEVVGESERFDVVVSNPPYVAESEADDLQPEVADWEPRGALFGGPDGLSVVGRVISGAGRALRPGGLLALEVGAGQAAEVVGMVDRRDEYTSVRVRRDYSGRERIVLAERTSN